MKAIKDNKVYRVDDSNKKHYLAEGFDIYNDEGKLVEHSPAKKISYAEYEKALTADKAEAEILKADVKKLESEIEKLKSEIEKLETENKSLKAEAKNEKKNAEQDKQDKKEDVKKAGE